LKSAMNKRTAQRSRKEVRKGKFPTHNPPTKDDVLYDLQVFWQSRVVVLVGALGVGEA